MARETRSLECEIDQQTFVARCDELGHVIGQIAEKERQKKEVTSDLSAELKTLKARQAQLGKIIRERTEERDVECVEHADDRTFTVTLIRQDTLEPVGDPRKMSEDEIARARQGKLPLDGRKPKRAKPAMADGGGPSDPAALEAEEQKAADVAEEARRRRQAAETNVMPIDSAKASENPGGGNGAA